MQINELVKEIHENSVAHGWWENKREFPEIIALCHSELSEALEADRKGEPVIWDNDGKPDGAYVELADCVIRIIDYLGYMGVDVEKLILEKHNFNRTRPYKHGKNY